MRLLIVALALAASSAWAQPPPVYYPPGPNREGVPVERYDLRDQNSRQPQWDERERHRQWREQRRWCREWRDRVERHPRLILPRECRR